MRDMPRLARAYVPALVGAGAALFGGRLPSARFDEPMLFVGLMLISALAASLKLKLPYTTAGSMMSVSYAVDFTSLLLLGPDETMLVAVAGVAAERMLKKEDLPPFFRTVFDAASVIITVQAAGFTAHLLGGATPSMPLSVLARPLVGAA